MHLLKNTRKRHLFGDILILAALLILFFTYYPFLQLYLLTPVLPTQNQGYTISIPRIKAYAPVIQNVNPWQKSEYLKALSQGVAEAQGNPMFLFAHSSDLPWRITRYNTAFLRLGELQTGDRIILTKNGQTHQYEVTGKKEVWPEEVQYLKQADSTQLTLMTCTPVGTSLKRLLVFARPL